MHFFPCVVTTALKMPKKCTELRVQCRDLHVNYIQSYLLFQQAKSFFKHYGVIK